MYMLTYKDAKSLVICGDIHGDFVPLVYEMCMRYGMRDTLVIVAGDSDSGLRSWVRMTIRFGASRNVWRRITVG